MGRSGFWPGLFFRSLIVHAVALPSVSGDALLRDGVQSTNQSNTSLLVHSFLELDKNNSHSLERAAEDDDAWTFRRDDLQVQLYGHGTPQTPALEAQATVAAFEFVMENEINRMAGIDDEYPQRYVEVSIDAGVVSLAPEQRSTADIPVPLSGREVEIVTLALSLWVDEFSSDELVPSAHVTVTRVSDGVTVARGAILFGFGQALSTGPAINSTTTIQDHVTQKRIASRHEKRNVTLGLDRLNASSSDGDSDSGLTIFPWVYSTDRYRVELHPQGISNVRVYDLTNFLLIMHHRIAEEVARAGHGNENADYITPFFTAQYQRVIIDLLSVDPQRYRLRYVHLFAVNEALRAWRTPGSPYDLFSLKIRVFGRDGTGPLLIDGSLNFAPPAPPAPPPPSTPTHISSVTQVRKRGSLNSTNLAAPEAPYVVDLGPIRFSLDDYRPSGPSIASLMQFCNDLTSQVLNQAGQTMQGLDMAVPNGRFSFSSSGVQLDIAQVDGKPLTFQSLVYLASTLRFWGESGLAHQKMPSATISMALLSQPGMPIAKGSLSSGSANRPETKETITKTQRRALSRSELVPVDPHTRTRGDTVFTASQYSEPYMRSDNLDHFLEDFVEAITFDDVQFPVVGPDREFENQIMIYSSSGIRLELYVVNAGSFTYDMAVELTLFIRQWGIFRSYERAGVVFTNIPSIHISLAKNTAPDVPVVSGFINGPLDAAAANSNVTKVTNATIATNATLATTAAATNLSRSTTDDDAASGVPQEPFITTIAALRITMRDYTAPYLPTARFSILLHRLVDEISFTGRDGWPSNTDHLSNGHINYEYDEGSFDMTEVNNGKLTWGVAMKVMVALRQWGLSGETWAPTVPSVSFFVSDSSGRSIVQGKLAFRRGLSAGNGTETLDSLRGGTNAKAGEVVEVT